MSLAHEMQSNACYENLIEFERLSSNVQRMSKRNELLYLGRAVDTAQQIVERTNGLTRAEFDANETIQLALTHLVQVIGEMAAKVAPAYAQIDWKRFVEVRDRIVANLTDPDLNEVWDCAMRDVPALLTKLEPMIPEKPPAADSPTAGSLAIPVPHERIAEFCRKWGVRKLSFFGSVVRDDFRPESDVDVLVEFRPGATPGLRFFVDMPNELSDVLGGRKVDLVTEPSLNRWIKADVLAEAVTEYHEQP